MRSTKWKLSDLETTVSQSRSIRQVLMKLGLIPAGGNYVKVSRHIKELGISTSHFLGKGWNIDSNYIKKEKAPLLEILVKDSSYQSYKLKKRLFEESFKKKACEKCQWSMVSKDGRIPLELHHINGVRTDNRIENLMILCPNCHSLESNYRGRNKNARVVEW